jgi:uncharacterized protein (DUF849 family)
LTGAGDTAGIHPDLPSHPSKIAAAAVDAAKAGAAVVHIHVRDPRTGGPSRRSELYAEVVERIRGVDANVVLNLTTGMGGDLYVGDGPDDIPAGGSDLAGPAERVAHVAKVLPDICTLDLGTMNFGEPRSVYLAPVSWVAAAAQRIRSLGVKPELQAFDLGHLGIAAVSSPTAWCKTHPWSRSVLGVKYGASADTVTMQTMVPKLPPRSIWSAFGTGRAQMPMGAQAILLGGNIRVGLEDNLYLSRADFASNAQTVERAASLAARMGATVMTDPARVRATLGLTQPRPYGVGYPLQG